MNKEEVFKLAEEHGATTWVNGCPLFMPDQLLSFANACEKIGMEKAEAKMKSPESLVDELTRRT